MSLALCAGSSAAADLFKPAAYYFPRNETCTVMMDFQKARERLSALNHDARTLELARSMLAEWSAGATTKCSGASKATILAVYIPGLDVYGRPDFGNRTNLLKLEGDANKLQALGRTGERITMAQIRRDSVVVIF